MKSIMISIQPQWVEKILNKEKTIEIRKTFPKCKLPCKVYIYCTKGKSDKDNLVVCHSSFPAIMPYNANGKVIAEFTLNQVDEFSVFENGSVQYWNCYNLENSCLTYEQIAKYIGYDKKYGYRNGYAWFISDLKAYYKPKELSDFRKDLDCDDYPCNKNRDCKYNYYDYSEGCWACGIDFDGTNCIYKQLTKPPKSWVYVEENKNGI